MNKNRVIIQFTTNIGLRILGLISGIFVARMAGPEVLGTITFATSFVSIFFFLNNLWGTPHIKFVSEGHDLAQCMATFVPLKLISSLIFIISVSVFILIRKYYYGFEFEESDQETVIWISLFAITIYDLLNIPSNTYVAQLKQAKAIYPSIVRELTHHLGRVIIVYLGYKAVALVSLDLFTAVLVLPIGYKLFRNLPYSKFNKKLAFEYAEIAFPLLIGTIIGYSLKYADKIMLGYFFNTSELGYYSAAFSIGGLLIVVGQSVGIIFFPLFSKHIKLNDWGYVNKKIYTYLNFLAIFIFPLVCTLALISRPLIHLILGEQYSKSVIPFSILLFASYFTISGTPFGNVLSGLGKFKITTLINFFLLIIFCLSLYLLLAPSNLNLGATGLAINTLIVSVATNFLNFYYAKKYGSVFFKKDLIIKYLLIGLIGILFYFFGGFLTFYSKWMWILNSLIQILVTYFFLYVFGFLKKENIILLLDVFNFKKTLKYAINEVTEK